MKTIGVGGNATVSLVENNNKMFACKTIPKTLDPSVYSERKCKINEASIKKEIRIMEKLKNDQCFVRLEDVCQDKDNYYIVMEYCAGGDITSFLQSNHNFTEYDIRDIIRQVLKIVAKCHDNNIVHNDIKPENFVFKEPGNLESLTLLDFGISFEAKDADKADFITMEGTPWYMSVESLQSKTNKKSDVWSIGVMTHFLLTGSFPFNDKKNRYKPSVYLIWNSILNDDIDFTKPKWANISKEAKDFVRMLLNKDVNARPTVYEALVHPWITSKAVDISKNIGDLVAQNLVKYSKKNIVMRTVFEDFVGILLSAHKDVLENVPLDNKDGSLYNSPHGIVSINSQRLSYILKVLQEKSGKDDSLKKADIEIAMRRLNSQKALIEYIDRIKEGSESVDMQTIVASQIDWDYILENSVHFEQFLKEVFSLMDKNNNGEITKKQNDLQNDTKSAIFSTQSVLSFEDFLDKVREVVNQTPEEEGRVHGAQMLI